MTNIVRHTECEEKWHLWTILEGKNANLINKSSHINDEATRNKVCMQNLSQSIQLRMSNPVKNRINLPGKLWPLVQYWRGRYGGNQPLLA